MPKLAGHEHFAGDHIARIRIGIQHADRRYAERRLRQADGVDQFDDPGGAEQSVLSARHRRRAGVTLEASQANLVPTLALPMRDDADVDRFILEDRPLLDMQFKERMNRAGADRLFALETDPLQLFAKRLAVAVQTR